jgi:hypothetical protein
LEQGNIAPHRRVAGAAFRSGGSTLIDRIRSLTPADLSVSGPELIELAGDDLTGIVFGRPIEIRDLREESAP